MTTIKLILMDKDGSTIAPGEILPDNLKSLILNSPNMNWSMATGRSFKNAILSPLGQCMTANALHIFDGGARIINSQGQIFYEALFTDQEIEIFFKQFKQKDAEHIFYAANNNGGLIWLNQANVDYKMRCPILKITTDLNEFKSWMFEVARPAKLSLKIYQSRKFHDLNWTYNTGFIDITPQNIDKGSACIKLLEQLNLKPEEAIFVFNDQNDLPLVNHPRLKNVIKLKVGDSLPNIKADYTAATPFEVAELLKIILDS